MCKKTKYKLWKAFKHMFPNAPSRHKALEQIINIGTFLNIREHTKNGMLLEEEERLIVPGVTVRAATLDALIDCLISSFLPVGGLKEENNNFPHVMFLMHQWFTSSENLAQCLITRYNNCEVLLNCHPSCPHTKKQMEECAIYRSRAQICYAFRYWIRTFPIHFDLNNILAAILKDFQRRLRSEGNQLADQLDLSKLPACDWARNISVRNPPSKRTRKISLVFDHLEPAELADHITFLEHKVMRRISFTEFKVYADCNTLQDNSKLERSIALFNGLSQWIQFMVLSRSLPQQRADVIVKIVNVAQKLLEQKNFNSLMSVIGGLSHSCLARLSKTTALIPAETNKKLDELSELLSSTSNFSNYRKSLAETRGFKIPILGVHMKDLISLHIALPDTVENGLINFRKVTQLSLIFQELWDLQNSIPGVMVNADLINTLKLSLNTAYSEDELYELSLLREPRASSLQSSPARLTMFSDWVAGLGEPDEEVLEKYLESIIEVMFKNYDFDKDGFISQDEFDVIQCNFPKIGQFSVLDVDKDGMISRVDMKSHFMKEDSKVLRIGFQHGFNETTYFKPTFCAHCAGLLWGLIKQGYKCKDCGINAHKHCKEHIVLECRRAVFNPARSNSFAPPDAVKSKGRMQRPWRRPLKSSQSDGDSSLIAKLESEFCSCDNGFITTNSAESTPAPGTPVTGTPISGTPVKEQRDVFPKKAPLAKSLSASSSPAPASPCSCRQTRFTSSDKFSSPRGSPGPHLLRQEATSSKNVQS